MVQCAPPENLSVFNSLLPKKETAVTEQSADLVSESNTYTVSKPVPQPIQADKTTHYENKEYTSIVMLPLHRSVLLHGRRYFE